MTSRFKLVVSEAFRSIGANLSTSFAATMTVLIGMFLLGLLIALGTWVVSWSDHVKDQLEVKVFFVDDVTPKQVNAVGSFLRTDERIKDYQFVTRAEALERMKKKYPELTADLPTNPLPASYEITPRQAEEVKELSAAIRAQKFAGVERVKDGQQTSKRILQVASVLLIANTIRLSIFARRREIEVMKLVGATNWFVRGPFMVEGLFCGLAGALAAVLLLLIGKELALSAILDDFDATSSADVQALGFSITALILIVVGLAVGAVGSGLTLRRYLKV
jgi:cell division transport system permease protein